MNLVQKAKDDKERLRASAHKKEAELATIYEDIKKVDIFIEMAERYGASGDFASPKPRKRAGGQAKTGLVEGVCETAIREKGAALPTVVLLPIVEQNEIEITSSDKKGWLAGILSRSDKFENVRGVGWQLKEWSAKPSDDGNKSESGGSEGHDQPKDEEPSPFQANGSFRDGHRSFA